MTSTEKDSVESQDQKQESDVKVEEGTNGCAIKDPTDLEQQIIKQVEFYFGDANLPRDKFMLEQVKLDDGWIPMNTMLKFQRLSRLSKDPDAVAAAMKHSQLVEVDTSGTEPKLRRSPEIPLPEFNAERRKAVMERTVYCKGFPLDSSIDAVMAVINAYGPTENILMRRYKDKLSQKYMFKGSVFVTFRTREEGQAFLDIPSVKSGDTELIRMWQNDYHEKKKKEAHSDSKSRSKVDTKKEKENGDDKSFKKGATIHLAGDFLTLTREDIKEAVGKFDIEPSYIGFNKGEKEAFLRLAEESSAQPAVEKLGAELTIAEAKLTVRVLDGEEEAAYLKKAEKDKKEHMQRCNRSKRANRQGGRKRKYRNKEDDGSPPQKKVVT